MARCSGRRAALFAGLVVLGLVAPLSSQIEEHSTEELMLGAASRLSQPRPSRESQHLSRKLSSESLAALLHRNKETAVS
jgi:hypothetical protein